MNAYSIKIGDGLYDEIQAYIEKNTPSIDWHGESISTDSIKKIFSDGLFEFEEWLWQLNMDTIFEMEDNFLREIVTEFKDKLKAYISGEITDEDELEDFLRESIRDNFEIYVDLNTKYLYRTADKVAMLIKVYSNYDCTNSFDDMTNCDYLPQVYQRVKTGVKKDDMMWEHMNGAYAGALFCFAFTMDLMDAVKLYEDFKTDKFSQILIPKGTQYGFFNNMHGCGSVFEKTTYRDMKLNINEFGPDYSPDYDNVGIVPDVLMSYNMAAVYGSPENFIKEQNIQLI